MYDGSPMQVSQVERSRQQLMMLSVLLMNSRSSSLKLAPHSLEGASFLPGNAFVRLLLNDAFIYYRRNLLSIKGLFTIISASNNVFRLDSGWAWLVKEGDKVAISKSPNAENPLAEGQTPLLTMDVWGRRLLSFKGFLNNYTDIEVQRFEVRYFRHWYQH